MSSKTITTAETQSAEQPTTTTKRSPDRIMLERWLWLYGFTPQDRTVPLPSTLNKSGHHVAPVWVSPSGRWEVYIPDEQEQALCLATHFDHPSTPCGATLVVAPRLCLTDPESLDWQGDNRDFPNVFSSVTVLDAGDSPWGVFLEQDSPYRIEMGLAEEKLQRAWATVEARPHRAAQLATAEGELCSIRRKMLLSDKALNDYNEDPNL